MLATMSRATRIDWRVPGALIALTVVPVLAGGARLAQRASCGPAIDDCAGFSASPTPVIPPIIAASVLGVLGALKLAPPVPQSRNAGGPETSHQQTACISPTPREGVGHP